MPASRAFDDTVALDSDGLHLNGVSDVLAGATLVARRVALAQGDHKIEGAATAGEVSKAWFAQPPLPAAGFASGRASAIGTETYMVADGVGPGVPLLTAFSWTQSVEIVSSAEAKPA
jgi:hypothetical protein